LASASSPVDQAELIGHVDQTRRIDYLGDGATAVTGSRDGDLRVWDTASGREVRHIDGAHAGRVQWVAGSPDGARIASTGDDGLAKIWDARREDDVRARVQALNAEIARVNARVAVGPPTRLAPLDVGDIVRESRSRRA